MCPYNCVLYIFLAFEVRLPGMHVWMYRLLDSKLPLQYNARYHVYCRLADNICEGFDHADAVPLSGDALEEAARQLRYANKTTQMRMLSSRQKLNVAEVVWASQVRVG